MRARMTIEPDPAHDPDRITSGAILAKTPMPLNKAFPRTLNPGCPHSIGALMKIAQSTARAEIPENRG